jgi:hypothetical protein
MPASVDPGDEEIASDATLGSDLSRSPLTGCLFYNSMQRKAKTTAETGAGKM